MHFELREFFISYLGKGICEALTELKEKEKYEENSKENKDRQNM